MMTNSIGKLLCTGAILFVFTTCTPKRSKEVVKIPEGFRTVPDSLTGLKRHSLLFFHLHHCPNCELTMSHLIPTTEFQQITKSHDRYVVSLDTPLGRILAKRYEVRGAPIFVVIDGDGTLITKSIYGYQGAQDFTSWFLRKQRKVEPREKLAMEQLQPLLAPIDKSSEAPSTLAYLLSRTQGTFSNLKPPAVLKAIGIIETYLSIAPKKSMSSSDQYQLHYRDAYIHGALSKLYELSSNKDKARLALENAYKATSKIEAGEKNPSTGARVFRIYNLIRLKKDEEVEIQIQNGLKSPNINRTALILNTAYGYLKFREDCSRVLKYTDMVPLVDIPTDTDRIDFTFFRAQCWSKLKKPKQLEKEYKVLMKLIPTSIKETFQSKIDGIEKLRVQ